MLGRLRASCVLASALGLALTRIAQAYTLDPNSTDSVKMISRQIADDMIDNYYFGHLPGNQPGILPKPYYWWEGGALMGALIDYWYYTGDTKFNKMTMEGLLAQVGEEKDYMPAAQAFNEGNDDQGFWGVAVMAAAEYRFPDPPPDKPQWLALAQAVFNTQASRWDMGNCNGGLRWQVYDWNNGFDYKNTISQGCFFNIASRLALYTGNTTYAEWADRAWDWIWGIGIINTETWWIQDGARIAGNCTNITPYVWTYNTGVLMHGVAAMYNFTTGASRQRWADRLDKIVDMAKIFFNGTNKDVMSEVACEPVGRCNIDQQSFKAYLSRWMAATTKWAPQTSDRIMPLLRSSAVAAAQQCTGGENGRMCGLRWIDEGRNDGLFGLGQMMAALEVVISVMAVNSSAPVTDNSGGTSRGDPGAGGRDIGRTSFETFAPISSGDRAGAYALTVASLVGLFAAVVFVLMDETEKKSWPQRWSELRLFIVHGGRSGDGAATIVAGGLLRKKAPSAEEKGKAVDAVGEVHRSDSDGSTGTAIADANRTKNVNSMRVFSMGPISVRQAPDSGSAPEQGAGFRRSATHQLERSGPTSTKRNSLKKSAAPSSPRPSRVSA
ncbi:hypothetical protein MCOR25_010421 [Pyricularia grisea]|uniref:mannan endo-1,6-alpha-mannosidase n=1 Tax=Pyricularia grisea TaxID=148305 RepID=A0A6P8AY15_PYRGI|nr:hypothetical protein PgNI_10585 [Pyricularia grisea]KAI6350747.1 hypothetical protein MCOR25_010421 [Pyricularia grisea]TLD07227.1 hypothetical protein PgNI_10585 [Pyricularia grisea]